jgi:hypothetical protein
MRVVRSSIMATLTWGAAGGVDGTGGQPRTQATAMASEAATAPETIATTQDETAVVAGS